VALCERLALFICLAPIEIQEMNEYNKEKQMSVGPCNMT